MVFLRVGDWTSDEVWNYVRKDYDVRSMLGSGSDGVIVFKGRDIETGEKVALKFMPLPSDHHRKRALKELRLLEKATHQHVVWVHGLYMGSNLAVLVEERCATDLFEVLSKTAKPFTEQKALEYFKQMLSALIHCHRIGIAHRDIKLENFFITSDGAVRLGDFGLAEEYQPTQLFVTSVGTRGYVAPEVLDTDETRPCSPEATDVFSLGATLFAMLVGDFPYQTDFIEPEDVPAVPRTLSEPCRRLILSMTAVDPTSRPRLEGIPNHPWYKGIRVCKLTYSADSAAFVASLPSPTAVATRNGFDHLKRNATLKSRQERELDRLRR